MRKRIGILTGGGDVQVLNTVLASAKQEAQNLNLELIGFLRGWEGVLQDNYVDLSNRTIDPAIGGTILKSSRVNINKAENGYEIALNNLKKNKIAGLIVIGGEDTLSNSFEIKEFPQILIAKTIDNDVGSLNSNNNDLRLEDIVNYFTLGFPTAAEKIVSFVSLKEGLRTTAYSHERILIVESMGMHAGWLALSSAFGHPDLIIIPEFPLNYERFRECVLSKYASQGHLIIVVAEGARWDDGSHFYTEKDENEDFDHPRFGGSAQILKNRLKNDIANFLNPRNINSVNPSYLYRSGAPNKIDHYWAQKLGEKAVEILSAGLEKPTFLFIQKENSGFCIKDFPLSNYGSIADLHRFVDKRFYNPEEYQITEDGKNYLREIISEIPLDRSYGIKKEIDNAIY
jgi:6-phosphofructokinase 1